MRLFLLTALSLLGACTGPEKDSQPGTDGPVDADGDGYDIEADCDDENAAAYPGAEETCDGVDNDCDTQVDEVGATGGGTWYADGDNDGYGDPNLPLNACAAPSGYVTDATDCDDDAAYINPGAAEICDDDDIDENCNGSADDADSALSDASRWYEDLDGDGFGGTGSTYACDLPAGYVTTSTDCDDGASGVYPGATEVCDEVDNDCDSLVDEAGSTTYHADDDGDGYGDEDETIEACSAPDGYVDDASDCNDNDAEIHPGATEVCDEADNDCDGNIDDLDTDRVGGSTWYSDSDSDGYGNVASTAVACEAPSGYVADSTDCNDSYDDIYPNAFETCDGDDNDCNGVVDDGDYVFYGDADLDGHGDATQVFIGCYLSSGYSTLGDDCDDTNAAISPEALEACDEIDNDCDGLIDDDDSAVQGSRWYLDQDADSFGDASMTTIACDQPTGYVADATDCNDDAATDYPGASEICDSTDNNCDGRVDEGFITRWYLDADLDTYGSGSFIDTCVQPDGYVADATDCNDADAAISPSAAEVCDDVDNNCDGRADEGVATTTWYYDSDADGYGVPSTTVDDCGQPTGYADNADDCNDASSLIYPGANDRCDSIDNDCDGLVDEDLGTYYIDTDSDGYGTTSSVAISCFQPSGYVATNGDCNDSNASINPGVTEICDAANTDENCDGSADGADADGALTWYMDGDSDGYTDAVSALAACDAPDGYGSASELADCDDTDALINPAAAEVCDAADNDCDGLIDDTDDSVTDATTWYTDADGDGYGDDALTMLACMMPEGAAAMGGDCDESVADIYPGAAERCDGIDNDCDTLVDDADDDVTDASTWYIDSDDDGLGDDSDTMSACEQPDGYVDNTDDPFEDALLASFLADADLTEATDVVATETTLYVAGFSASNEPLIVAIDRTTGAWSEVYAGDPLVQPVGITVYDSTLYVADTGVWTGTTYGAVFALSTDGSSITALAEGDIDLPADVAAGPDGLYVSALTPMGAPALFTLDPVTGDVATLSSGMPLVDPLALAVAPDGWLYVVDSMSDYGMAGIMMFDPADGSYDGDLATGGSFDVSFPGGLAIDSMNRIFWTTVGPAALMASANDTVVTLPATGLELPTGLAVYGTTLYVTDVSAAAAADLYTLSY